MSSRPLKEAITRRTFLKGTGAGIAAAGLSPLVRGLTGCGSSPKESLLYGNEMVGKITADSATIRLVAGIDWSTSTTMQVFYDTVSRTDPLDYLFQTPQTSAMGEHDPVNFELKDLLPNTRYYYRTGCDTEDGMVFRDEYSFHTQRAPGSSFRFCVSADTHMVYKAFPSGTRLKRITYENILADSPDILLSLGDDAFVGYQGGLFYAVPDEAAFYKTWKALRRLALDYACHSMFYLPVNGNHDGLYGWTSDWPEYQYQLNGKLAYTPVPDGETFPEGGDALGRYGAFTWGDVLFLWLDVVGFCEVDPVLVGNSYYILGDDQLAFMEATLKNSSAPWKFVFSHHLFGGLDTCLNPKYGRGNANAAAYYDQALIHNKMIEHGAQAFFYGHDHVFSVSEADTVAYVCAGRAGSPCPWAKYLKQCYQPYLLYPTDDNGTMPNGHVRVDVSPTETTVSYIRASTGEDNGSIVASYVIPL